MEFIHSDPFIFTLICLNLKEIIERLRTFILTANGKNSTSAVCRLSLVRGKENFCVCRECGIFSLIL